MTKGNYIVYLGETDLHYTKNKKYKVNKPLVHRVTYFFNIINDIGMDVMVPVTTYSNIFKFEKDLRKEKLNKINDNIK